jgi:hypothetical protein
VSSVRQPRDEEPGPAVSGEDPMDGEVWAFDGAAFKWGVAAQSGQPGRSVNGV